MSLEIEKLLLSDFGLAFWLYLGALAIFIATLAFPRRILSNIGLGLVWTGLAAHTLVGIGRAISVQRIPISNMYEYILLLSWATVIGFLILMARVRKNSLGVAGLAVIIGLIVAASLLPERREVMLVPALQSYWLTIHVVMAILGEAAFAIAFASSVVYLVKERKPGTPDGAVMESLANVTDRAIAVGYPLFTLGALFAGAIWAQRAWGTFWSWDPKEVGSLVVWLVYSAYIHTRFLKGWGGRRAAWLSITGFLLALGSFFGNMLLKGLHAYG